MGSESAAAAVVAASVVPGVAGPPAPCVPSGRRYDPPSFYLYDLPALDWAVRLAKCFEERVGLPPWKYASTKNQTRDGAPPDLEEPEAAQGRGLSCLGPRRNSV